MKENAVLIDNMPFKRLEAKVVVLLLLGLKRKEMADCLGYSEHHIKGHCTQIYFKFQVDNKAKLIAKLRDKGFDSQGYYKGEDFLESRDRSRLQRYL